MAGRWKDFLQLIRLPNVFTAVADVLAGYLIVRGSQVQPLELLGLMACSSAVYAGGCALNDYVDRDVDARERPSRPLPSGKVSPGEALVLTAALFLGALLAVVPAGTTALFNAVLLVACVVVYDLYSKNADGLGPPTMAMCRALNLTLGMSVNTSAPPAVLILPFLSFIYVLTLTILSRFEVNAEIGSRARVVAVGWGSVMAALGFFMATGFFNPGAVLYYPVLAIWTGNAVLEALITPSPGTIGGGVKAMILAIPLLDATYAAGFHGFVFGIPVLLLLLPALWISRRLYVT